MDILALPRDPFSFASALCLPLVDLHPASLQIHFILCDFPQGSQEPTTGTFAAFRGCCAEEFTLDLSPLCMRQTALSSLPLSVPGQRRSPRAGSAHSLYCSGVQYGASPTKERRWWDRWRLKGSCGGMVLCKEEGGSAGLATPATLEVTYSDSPPFL